MNYTKNNGDKTLTVAPTKTLTLKRPVEQGVVRQSFSHGRSKAVVVEKVKHRIVGRADVAHKESTPSSAPAKPVLTPQAAPATPTAVSRPAAPAAAPISAPHAEAAAL